MTTIYGIFSTVGKCLYVGRTKNTKARNVAHRNRLMRGRDYSFRVLRRVVDCAASKVEAKEIMFYRSRGEAALNKHRTEKTFTHKISLTLSDETEHRLGLALETGMKKAVVITQALDAHLPKRGKKKGSK